MCVAKTLEDKWILRSTEKATTTSVLTDAEDSQQGSHDCPSYYFGSRIESLSMAQVAWRQGEASQMPRRRRPQKGWKAFGRDNLACAVGSMGKAAEWFTRQPQDRREHQCHAPEYELNMLLKHQ